MTQVRLTVPSEGDLLRIFNNPNRSALLEAGVRTDAWKGVKQSTDVIAGWADGDLVCMAGAVPASMLSSSATVWLLATKHIESHSFLFFRYGREYLKVLKEKYSYIDCYCRRDNEYGTRWLHILGFDIVDIFEKFGHYRLRRY